MGAVIGIGLFIIIAILSRGSARGSTDTPAPQPDALPKLPDGNALPPKSSDADESAQTQADIDSAIKEEDSKLPPNLASPIAGVSASAWQKYVKKQIGASVGNVTKGLLYGMFLMGARVLQDVGVMQNVKITKQADGSQAFDGEFVAPMTREKFLASVPAQYEAFRRMSANHAGVIARNYKETLAAGGGSDALTLSGLMGVAKQAGLKGMDLWVNNPGERKDSTTAAFKRVNGIF